MFAFLELPKTFDQARESFVQFSEAVIQKLESASEEVLIRSDEELTEIVKEKPGIYWLNEGSVLLMHREKRIAAFEAGECFGLDMFGTDSPFGLENELAVRVGFVPLADAFAAISADHEALSAFVSLQSAYGCILGEMLSISPLLESPFSPDIVNAEAGQTIITEGEKEDEIFTLVKGELEVTVQGVPVGTIQEGEVFGVIAAFTGGARTATVVAKTDSMLMKLPKEEFDALVRQRPSMVTNLVESMSRSIVELDEKFLECDKKVK